MVSVFGVAERLGFRRRDEAGRHDPAQTPSVFRGHARGRRESMILALPDDNEWGEQRGEHGGTDAEHHARYDGGEVMTGDTDQTQESRAARDSFRGLLEQLAGHAAALLRDEIDLAKQTVQSRVRRAVGGLATMVLGVIVAQAALLALCTAAVIGLAPRWGWGTSAFIVGIGLAVLGGVMGFIGVRQLSARHHTPQQTLQRAKGGHEWLNESA